jgi:hypothetical protein
VPDPGFPPEAAKALQNKRFLRRRRLPEEAGKACTGNTQLRCIFFNLID